MIRIGIDGNEANISEKVGIGQYSFQMINHINGLLHNSEIELVIYLKDKPRNDFPSPSSKLKYEIFGPKKLWTQIALPIKLRTQKHKNDIFFSPSHYAPRFAFSKTAISIMDLSYLLFPELFRKSDLYQLINWTNYSVKKASVIFTISEFSKNEIMKYYPVSEEKIIVTYPGYDVRLFKSQISNLKNYEQIKKKYRILGEYILFVGTLQPRKNIVRLIESFNLAMEKLKDNKSVLLIVGKKGWLYEEIFDKVKKLGLEKRVVFTEFLADEELAVIYSNAKCLILPSLYEGFGIPVIEAMACGCPTIVSNVSSLPEIVGQASIMIDPYSVSDISKGIMKMYSETIRQQFIMKGLERVKLFDWQKSAQKALQVLRKEASKLK